MSLPAPWSPARRRGRSARSRAWPRCRRSTRWRSSGVGVDAVVREFRDHRFGGDAGGRSRGTACWPRRTSPSSPSWCSGVVARPGRDRRGRAEAAGHQLEAGAAGRHRPRRAPRRAPGSCCAAPDVPTEVVIDEYVELAKAFFDGPTEPGFVNAALDAWRGTCGADVAVLIPHLCRAGHPSRRRTFYPRVAGLHAVAGCHDARRTRRSTPMLTRRRTTELHQAAWAASRTVRVANRRIVVCERRSDASASPSSGRAGLEPHRSGTRFPRPSRRRLDQTWGTREVYV